MRCSERLDGGVRRREVLHGNSPLSLLLHDGCEPRLQRGQPSLHCGVVVLFDEAQPKKLIFAFAVALMALYYFATGGGLDYLYRLGRGGRFAIGALVVAALAAIVAFAVSLRQPWHPTPEEQRRRPLARERGCELPAKAAYSAVKCARHTSITATTAANLSWTASGMGPRIARDMASMRPALPMSGASRFGDD